MIWALSAVYIAIAFGVYGGEYAMNKKDKVEAIIRGLLWPLVVLFKLGNEIAYW